MKKVIKNKTRKKINATMATATLPTTTLLVTLLLQQQPKVIAVDNTSARIKATSITSLSTKTKTEISTLSNNKNDDRTKSK